MSRSPEPFVQASKLFRGRKQTETKGAFGGLGIYINKRDDRLLVVRPMEDTPAWKVGLKPGDHIVKIDDIEQVAGVDFFPDMEDTKEDAVEASIADNLWPLGS